MQTNVHQNTFAVHLSLANFVIEQVDFIWINRNQQAFEWFVSLLANIELQQKEIHEGHNINPNDSQEEDNFIDMQV